MVEADPLRVFDWLVPVLKSVTANHPPAAAECRAFKNMYLTQDLHSPERPLEGRDRAAVLKFGR